MEFILLILVALNSVLLIFLLIRAFRKEEKTDISEEFRKNRMELLSGISTVLNPISNGIKSSDDRFREEMLEQIRANERHLTSTLEIYSERLEEIRRTLETRIRAMEEANTKKLDEMRGVVDEKLQATLNERISQSFREVSERLAEVHRGLGEMQTLASGVGDLKRVLSNVKTRGILGEIQLGAILEDILSPDQYETNVVTSDESRDPVEFVIKLPGATDSSHVYLPIDSKFPLEAYMALTDAYDSADRASIAEAKKQLITRIRGFAKDIKDKYVAPPKTTDFAVMFLPTEGLYAEVIQLGLVEALQNDYRITVAGPTTMAALLNSLQMGFRTLAIQKRSSEIWDTLSAVKTQFAKFEKTLSKAQERLTQTSTELESLVGARTRQINRRLREITEMPEDASELYFPSSDAYNDSDSDEPTT